MVVSALLPETFVQNGMRIAAEATRSAESGLGHGVMVHPLFREGVCRVDIKCVSQHRSTPRQLSKWRVHAVEANRQHLLRTRRDAGVWRVVEPRLDVVEVVLADAVAYANLAARTPVQLHDVAVLQVVDPVLRRLRV